MKKFFSLILIILAAISLTACGKKTINLNDYLSVQFDGTNGSGKASVVGFSDFENAVLQELGDEANMMQLAVLEAGVSYKLDKTENLTNGDEVTLQIRINSSLKEAFDLNIVGENKKFMVAGLPEKVYTELNPFDNIELAFTGNSPYVELTVKDNNDKQLAGKIEIEYPDKNSTYLKNGDVVTLSYTYDLDKAEKAAIKITQITHEITVENSDVYIQSWDELNKEQQDKIIQAAKDKIETYIVQKEVANDGINSIQHTGDLDSTNLKYNGLYFFTPKDRSVINSDRVYNSMFFVFTGNMYEYDLWSGSKDKIVNDTTITIYVKNIVITSDGYMVFDTSMIGSCTYYDDTDMLYNNVVIRNKELYNYVDLTTFE